MNVDSGIIEAKTTNERVRVAAESTQENSVRNQWTNAAQRVEIIASKVSELIRGRSRRDRPGRK